VRQLFKIVKLHKLHESPITTFCKFTELVLGDIIIFQTSHEAYLYAVSSVLRGAIDAQINSIVDRNPGCIWAKTAQAIIVHVVLVCDLQSFLWQSWAPSNQPIFSLNTASINLLKRLFHLWVFLFGKHVELDFTAWNFCELGGNMSFTRSVDLLMWWAIRNRLSRGWWRIVVPDDFLHFKLLLFLWSSRSLYGFAMRLLLNLAHYNHWWRQTRFAELVGKRSTKVLPDVHLLAEFFAESFGIDSIICSKLAFLFFTFFVA